MATEVAKTSPPPSNNNNNKGALPGLARNNSIDPKSLSRIRRVRSPKNSKALNDSGHSGVTTTSTENGSINSNSFSSVNSAKLQWNHESVKFSAKNFVTSNAGTLESHYQLGDLIGEGGFGEVYSCQHLETGEIRAVKVMEKSTHKQSINDDIVKEYNILKELDHPKYATIL